MIRRLFRVPDYMPSTMKGCNFFKVLQKMLRSDDILIAFRCEFKTGSYDSSGKFDELAFRIVDREIAPLHYDYDVWLKLMVSYAETTDSRDYCGWETKRVSRREIHRIIERRKVKQRMSDDRRKSV